ncbi:CubicO group peptidase, beta-lactamase class C family [Rhizobiales bacterium GAS188]|nr:CubicO group peptidase, beta-lactamase class C family [Rhizobiales bacterium GAS188]
MTVIEADALPRRVDAAISTALAEQRLVGAVVLVARDGEIVHRGVAGFADREAGRAMREDSIFRFSSLTKPIVSAAAMALLEDGRMRLDDELSRWIPEFRPRLADGKEAVITVRQLLTHTAGLTYGLFQPSDGPYARHGVSDGLAEPGLSMAEELSRLALAPLSYTPGTEWGYSLALDVLGEVLARVAGATLPAVVEQKVTGPLGMHDTSFAVRDTGRLAAAYVDSKPPRLMHDPDVVPFGEGAGIRFSPSRIFDPSSFASGGAGLAGTAGNFLIFLETVRRGGAPILKAESARAMMSNQIDALRITTELTPSFAFGFGGAVLMDRELAGLPQANGTWKWGGVYGHHWYVDPVNRLTVVALTNTAIEGMAGGFVAELRSAVYGN